MIVTEEQKKEIKKYGVDIDKLIKTEMLMKFCLQ